MTTRLFYIVLLFVSISTLSCSNESNQSKEAEINEGGYILPPSHLLDGIQPEASWIWDSGEINPRNYYLHVRKSFTLENPAKKKPGHLYLRLRLLNCI